VAQAPLEYVRCFTFSPKPETTIAKLVCNLIKTASINKWLSYQSQTALLQLALQIINSTDSHQKRPPKINDS